MLHRRALFFALLVTIAAMVHLRERLLLPHAVGDEAGLLDGAAAAADIVVADAVDAIAEAALVDDAVNGRCRPAAAFDLAVAIQTADSVCLQAIRCYRTAAAAAVVARILRVVCRSWLAFFAKGFGRILQAEVCGAMNPPTFLLGLP